MRIVIKAAILILFVFISTLLGVGCSSSSEGTIDTVPEGKQVLLFSKLDNSLVPALTLNFDQAKASLFRVNADGSDMRALVPDQVLGENFTFDVSPDGTRIAFTAGYDSKTDQPCPTHLEGCNEEILVMDSYGTNLVRVTRNTLHDFSPDLSPNGKQLVFLRGTEDANDYGKKYIMVSNVDGSGEYQLTHFGEFRSPTWAPNGEHIGFFVENEDDYLCTVVVVDADGGNPRELSRAALDCETKLVWSPRSDQIAFTYGLRDLYLSHLLAIANVDSSEVQIIGERDSLSKDVQWSPDGERIAFFRSGGANADNSRNDVAIVVMKTDDSANLQIPEAGTFSSLFGNSDFGGHSLAWSSDGTQLAFFLSPENEKGFYSPNVYMIDVDGSNLRRVTDFGYTESTWGVDIQWAFIPDPPTK